MTVQRYSQLHADALCQNNFENNSLLGIQDGVQVLTSFKLLYALPTYPAVAKRWHTKHGQVYEGGGGGGARDPLLEIEASPQACQGAITRSIACTLFFLFDWR